MQVLFPNPFGYKLPNKRRVQALQQRFNFSDQYAEFLLTHNGFFVDRLEESPERARYLSPGGEDAENTSDLRVLYGFDSGDEFYDLEGNLDSVSPFEGVFFPIGVGYGGNAYVEVLRGKYKGSIGSLDHEMYFSSSSLEDFVEELGLDGFWEMSADQQADALADKEFVLLWHHATSMKEFVEQCIHCNDRFFGFALDAASVGADRT